MRILTEASGSLTSAYLQKRIKEAGHYCVGSDINPINSALCMADDFVIMPKCSDKDLWEKTERALIEKKIDVVIPSLDETLLGWAERKVYFKKKGISVIISNPEVVELFQDKWKTHETFKKFNMPCPESSLEFEHPLTKPRFGRGSQGILINEKPHSMEGLISQELLEGEEYTVDCFYDINNKPIYIIPRKRLEVKDGKSTKGEVVKQDEIVNYIKEFSKEILFIGPINFQCFVSDCAEIKFIEINPRIAGGMALGMEASENWIYLIIENIINNQPIAPKKIKYGLKMIRYYAECFIS